MRTCRRQLGESARVRIKGPLGYPTKLEADMSVSHTLKCTEGTDSIKKRYKTRSVKKDRSGKKQGRKEQEGKPETKKNGTGSESDGLKQHLKCENATSVHT